MIEKRKKTGGRKKGTPNKVTKDIKSWIEKIINDNFQQIQADLSAMKPDERFKAIVSLLPYVIPKQQSVSIEAQIEAEMKAINKALETADDEVLSKIADKMLKNIKD
ncbi:MAG: hypothetical protein J6M30_02080 [Bacteroidales bacterium]|nr:hypothetical protein [Bacteroidales bacterium]